jgi:hypothetical protein
MSSLETKGRDKEMVAWCSLLQKPYDLACSYLHTSSHLAFGHIIT